MNPITPSILAVLRKLVEEGSIPLDTVVGLDQRPLRGCYIRGWFTFTKEWEAVVTEEGIKAWELLQGEARTRLNSEAPLFGLVQFKRQRRRKSPIAEGRRRRRARV